MTTAETLYRALLRLYPKEHRQAYCQDMLQHARDLELAAQERGRLTVTVLYLHLVGDGIVNAGKEHWSALRAAGGSFKPVPWPAVLVAAIPGLWLVLTRRHADVLGPALLVLRTVYIVLLLTVPPLVWLRTRRLPVWTLLPLGMIAWLLVQRLEIAVASAAVPQDTQAAIWAVIAILMLALAAAIFAALLRGRRAPASAFIVIGLLLLGGLLLALLLSRTPPWSYRYLQRPMMYLAAALTGPATALLLVAIGLPAAQRHNVLAILVVIGGYGAMFLDSDYLWGSPYRDWPGLPLYLAGMIFLFFILAPVGLLRAKTRLGQAIALFVPAAIFLTARIAVPALVLGPAVKTRPGDVLGSVTILLSLILGWLLYGHFGDPEVQDHPTNPQVSA
jgi:hypothetical protein